MKRIVLIWMAAFLMGGMAMAQHARHSDKMPEPKVRAERMTERMVKEYSLNDTQKQQLLEANLALVEKIGDMPMHRAKAHKHHKRDGKRHQLTDEQRAQKKAEMEKKREEMKTARIAYDSQLRKIMTEEQYAAYSKKVQDRKAKMESKRKINFLLHSICTIFVRSTTKKQNDEEYSLYFSVCIGHLLHCLFVARQE